MNTTNARLPLVNLQNKNKTDKANKKKPKVSDQNIINESNPNLVEYIDDKPHNIRVLFVKLDR
jgi:hypothetical protein